MRARHKPPTLVSMWMLDVFCCALGCVTLLFLLNSRMASDEAAANKTALLDLQSRDRQLKAAISDLDAARLRLNSAEEGREKMSAALAELEGLRLALAAERDDLAKQLAAATTDRDDLAKKLAAAAAEAKDAKALLAATKAALAAAETKADTTAKELVAARTRAADADELLRRRQKEADALAKKIAEMTAAAEELQRLMRKRDDDRVLLAKQASEAKTALDDLDGKLAAARKERDDALAKAKDLLQKLDAASVTIIDLQGDKAKLADKVDEIRREAETRFAGIAMTGRRVVLVVDMSGSMAKKDASTADETKWPLVVETVCKVARSIPTLEKFQVVVFSSSARYLFPGGWQDYDGDKSVEAIRAALLKVVPQDDTNLYAGFDLAFRLRPAGLDTVYLFSDGLPTSGPGLSAAQQAANPPLKETERSEILGGHLRKVLREEWNRPQGGNPPVRINAIGFYFESPDIGSFLWSLARENDGNFVGLSKP
jgi:predicted  nucleic acid-binding Zn-ribbon protein